MRSRSNNQYNPSADIFVPCRDIHCNVGITTQSKPFASALSMDATK
jgi:hypothetical protein